MKKILLFLSFLLMSIGMCGESITITPPNFKSSYGDGTFTASEIGFAYSGVMYNAKNQPSGFGVKQLIQLRKSGNGAGEIKNNDELSLKTITIATQNDVSFTLSVGVTSDNLNVLSKPSGTNGEYNCKDNNGADKEADIVIYTFNVTGKKYFKFLNGGSAQYLAYILIELDDGESPTTYSVTYNDGGSATIKDETPYAPGASVITRKNTFTKDGYIFDCWQLGNRNIDEDSTFVITQDTALTARWLINVSKNDTTGDCVFYEEFNNCDSIGGNDGYWKDEQGSSVVAHKEITDWPYDFDNNGWDGTKTFIGYKCIKIGSSNYGGYIETPLINSEKNNELLLSFKAGAWDGSSEKTEIYLSSEDAVLDKTTIEIEKGTWNVYHVAMTEISNTFKIKWYVNSGKNRFFLDSICISPYIQEAPIDIVTWHNDSIFLSKDYFNEIDFKADSIRIKPLQSKKKLYEMPDSTLKVNVDLLGSYCDTLHFIVCNSTEAVEQHIKVPYIVESNEANIDIIDNDDKCDIVIHNKLNINTNKEKRDVIVYPKGILNIQENDTFTVNSLTLRRDNDSVPYLSYKGVLDIKNRMFFEMRTDGSDWRWLTLPDTFDISDVNANVHEGNVWSDALVKYYDGSHRAEHGSGGWKLSNTKAKYKPGEGIIFGAYIDSETEKRIYKMELDTNILSREKNNKEVLVYPYGKGTNKPANDLGWNVVGNPFMEQCNISSNNPIRIGILVQSDTDPWDGKWIVDSNSVETKVNYIVVKDYHDEYADAGYYKSIPLNIDGHSLEPFTSFFIQIDTALSSPSTLTFTKGSGISYAPARKTNTNNEIFLRVCVGNKKTGCFISNNHNDLYEIGHDLESNESIYQLINGYKLLYSAVNDSIIEHGIKVYTPTGNLHLDDKTNVEDFEEIYAFYNDEWIDLLHGQTQDVSGEFILFAKRKTQVDIPTDISIIKDNNEVIKFMHNNNLYIKKNNHIYNILGGIVK